MYACDHRHMFVCKAALSMKRWRIAACTAGTGFFPGFKADGQLGACRPVFLAPASNDRDVRALSKVRLDAEVEPP